MHLTDFGSGTPVLWIHGFPHASSIFEKQLAIRGVRHLMPDLPGFGPSLPWNSGGMPPMGTAQECRPADAGRPRAA